MENVNEVVNEEASQAAEEATNSEMEQESTASESVITQESDGKDYKVLYENARIALQEKNRKIAELKQTVVQPQEEVQDDDGVRRFLQTETDAYIARKAATDDSFKELLPEIEALMEVNPGMDIRTAEMQVKVAMFESISKQINQAPKVLPKQINTSVIPEPIQKVPTLNEIDPFLAAAIEREGL